MIRRVVQGLPVLVKVWRTHKGVELETERAERRQLKQYQWEGILSYLNSGVAMGMERRDCFRIY